MLERLYIKYLLSKMRKCNKHCHYIIHKWSEYPNHEYAYSMMFTYWNNKYWKYDKRLHKILHKKRIKGLE